MSAWEPSKDEISAAAIGAMIVHHQARDALVCGAGPTIATKDAEIARLRKALTKIAARNQVKRSVIINDQGMHTNQVRFFDGEFALIARAALTGPTPFALTQPAAWEPSDADLERAHRGDLTSHGDGMRDALLAGAGPTITALTAQNARLRAVIAKIKDALEAIQSEFKLDGELSDIVDAAVEAALVGDAV